MMMHVAIRYYENCWIWAMSPGLTIRDSGLERTGRVALFICRIFFNHGQHIFNLDEVAVFF
jgi:hypothetical protein